MKLLLFAVAGLMAQLVDGALGMAFGVTATTMLILSGTAPAQASAAVHFAEVGTTLFSGLAHWRLNNVHWPTVVFLGIPGAVGAFAGATVLSGLSTESAEPVVSTLLLLLGAYVLIRSVLVPGKQPEGGDPGDTGETVPVSSGSRRSRLGLVTLGLGGGFLDASGGGGWGPVTTSSLMSVGRSEPRKIIGTVNTAECLVAVSASLGFIIGLEQV
ncbi:MAG: sulfite exporter TauE/SafE family protein, partial [Corynebacterium sp.]|nr:sulfite exporter TauE/SafE family protein [Corynebacterium sp.]